MTLPVSFHRKPQKARKFSEIQVHSFMSIERIGKNQPGNDLQEKQIKRQRILRLPQEDYLLGRTKDRTLGNNRKPKQNTIEHHEDY